jgi:hypothetical protein
VQGLKEFGYVDGMNVDLGYRFADGHWIDSLCLQQTWLDLSPT